MATAETRTFPTLTALRDYRGVRYITFWSKWTDCWDPQEESICAWDETGHVIDIDTSFDESEDESAEDLISDVRNDLISIVDRAGFEVRAVDLATMRPLSSVPETILENNA